MSRLALSAAHGGPSPACSDGLNPAQSRTVVAAAVLVHALAAWGVWSLSTVPPLRDDPAPLWVSWVDNVSLAPTPARQVPGARPQPAPPRPERTLPAPPARPSVPTPTTPVLAAAPSPVPSSTPVAAAVGAPVDASAAPTPPPATATTPAAPVPVAVPAPAQPAPPAAPRNLPSSAVQYLSKPTPEYPRMSVRLQEAGVVTVRVFIDEAGLPHQVHVLRSSGFTRLDESAVAGVQRARFRPPTDNGQPVSGWARIDIPFELEN